MMRRIWLLIIVLWSGSVALHAMVYDNRFWPLYPQRFFAYQPYPCASWYFSGRGLFIGADRSYLEDGAERPFQEEEDTVDLFSLFGDYDELLINKAVQQVGLSPVSLINPELMALGQIFWRQPGKISVRGLALEMEAYLHPNISMGCSLFVGDMQSHKQLILNDEKGVITVGNRAALSASNQQLLELLHLTSLCDHSAVFGDVDLFIRGRYIADYLWKIHHVDIGLRLGTWLPAGTTSSLYNPVSLPIGGNGHTGFYGQLDCMLLLNEFISAGFSLNGSKRLSRTSLQRMPVAGEPLPYGALIGCATVTPGWTVAFNPYVQMGGLREGLGLMLGYFLVFHAQDRWCVNQALIDQFHPELDRLQATSQWGSDHFSVAAWYDFGFERSDSWSAPIISFTVDIPWKGPVTKRVTKAHAISLRIESRI